MNLNRLLRQQKTFFLGGIPREIAMRETALRRLLKAIRTHRDDIAEALAADIGKGEAEAYLTEITGVLMEGEFLLKHLHGYARPKFRLLEPHLWPARGTLRPEPYGIVLIISPWNYPFLLAMVPLMAAIAAGNTAIVKPSRQTPETAHLLKRIVADTLPSVWATVVDDPRIDGDQLLDLDVDKVFFTGSAATGRHVATRCAERLIPVTLELGGKSPAVVTESADIELAAKRIAFGKVMNAGQTCVAPDYVLADISIAETLTRAVCRAFQTLVPDGAATGDWPRIIKADSETRLRAMLDKAPIVCGGEWNNRRLAPTVLFPVKAGDAVMQEEIFGPILPILPYKKIDAVIRFINDRPKPLAAYFFSNDHYELRHLVQEISAGGICVNDTLMHVASHHLPFGGVGESGQGSYHGMASLRAMSHEKSVFIQSTRFDLPLRYMPYGRLKTALIKRL